MGRLGKLLATTALVALGSVSSGNAVPLVADGVTYNLTMQNTTNPLVEIFTLSISGFNTASDTEGGGRTGVNSIAFTNPSQGVTNGSMLAPPSGWTFKFGGLNSSGCDGSGNFYCFDNTAIPPTPTTALAGPINFQFQVIAASGNWNNYPNEDPHFKIDWVGSKNNYDLVSLAIPVNTSTNPPPPPPPPPDPIPEPFSLAIFGTSAMGLMWARRTGRKAGGGQGK